MAYSYEPHTFEEFEVGQTFETRGRTVTESDVVMHSAFSGDWTEVHTNREYAETTEFEGRIVHGPLTFSVASGLLMGCGIMERTVIAFVGIRELTLPQPLRIGETISLAFSVAEARPTDSRDDAGLVTFDVDVITGDDETVCSFDITFLVSREAA
jgi:acyl dehydratase